MTITYTGLAWTHANRKQRSFLFSCQSAKGSVSRCHWWKVSTRTTRTQQALTQGISNIFILELVKLSEILRLHVDERPKRTGTAKANMWTIPTRNNKLMKLFQYTTVVTFTDIEIISQRKIRCRCLNTNSQQRSNKTNSLKLKAVLTTLQQNQIRPTPMIPSIQRDQVTGSKSKSEFLKSTLNYMNTTGQYQISWQYWPLKGQKQNSSQWRKLSKLINCVTLFTLINPTLLYKRDRAADGYEKEADGRSVPLKQTVYI